MTLRFFTSIFLIVVCLTFPAQTTNPATKGTSTTTQKKYSQATTQSLVNTTISDTCLDKKFSIVFYLIQDSAFSILTAPPTDPHSLASYQLPDIMNLLNDVFRPICVSFEHCKTVIIPNYPDNRWKGYGNGVDITDTWYTENTINVYIPEEIDQPYVDPPAETAYAYPPPNGAFSPYPSPLPNGIVTPKNAIVFKKNLMKPGEENRVGFFGSSIIHVFGIFFGLPHTFDEINPTNIPSPPPPSNTTPPIVTLEYANHVNIQNCKDHGDGFCDTEADPSPAFLTVPSTIPIGLGSCSAAAGMVDGNGTPYLPPSDNFMSHYGCRCRFTHEQYNYMAKIIMTKRLYLH